MASAIPAPESVATGVSLVGGGSVSVAMVAAVFYEHCATMTTMADAYWSTLILLLDLVGTFAFGLSGGLAASNTQTNVRLIGSSVGNPSPYPAKGTQPRKGESYAALTVGTGEAHDL